MKAVNALSLYELNKYVTAVAQEAGLSIATSNKGYSYLQGKTLYISPEEMPLNEQRAMYQLRKIIHETAHYTDTDMQYWEDTPLTQESPLRSLWNMLEDHRIEHVQSQRYDGDADILDAGTSVAFGSALRSAKGLPKLGDPKKQAELDQLVAGLKWDRDNRVDWMPSLHEHDITLTPEQQVYYDKMCAHNAELRRVRAIEGKAGTKATYELAKRIFEDNGGDSKKEEQEGEKAREKGEQGGHGEKGGKGKEKGEGESEGTTPDDKALEEAREALTTSPHRDGTNPEFDGKPHPTGSKGYRGMGNAKAAQPSEFYVENFANPARSQYGVRGSLLSAESMHNLEYTKAASGPEIARTRAQGATSEQLAQRMRMLVQIKTRSRTQYGLKSGKLHGASLHRIAANVPGYSERVFKRKENHLDIDAAVGVCVDMSGSMAGAKVAHAVVAAEMLSETVGNALGVPLQIYGFSETRNITAGGGEASPSIFVLRDFNERQLPTERMRERSIKAIACTLGNNPDADAVIWGYHQLRAAKGKRKILFVLSDGSPASARSGDQERYLSEVTKLIEKSPIRLFGLGLMDSSVVHFYKNHAVVHAANEIETKIIQLVDNFILQG